MLRKLLLLVGFLTLFMSSLKASIGANTAHQNATIRRNFTSHTNHLIPFSPEPQNKYCVNGEKLNTFSCVHQSSVLLLRVICDQFDLPLRNCSCRSFTNLYDLTKPICNASVQIMTYNYHKKFSQTYASVSIISSACGIVGNAFVIVLTLRNRRRKIFPTFKKLITVLATCDFVFAVTQLMYVIPMLWTNTWLYGEILCKLLTCAETLGATLAIGIIVIISIERFKSVTDPYQQKSRYSVNKCLALNIFLSVAYSLPILMYTHVNEFQICRWSTPKVSSKAYHTFNFVCYFLLPISVISVLYFQIYVTLKRNANAVKLNTRSIEQITRRTKETRRNVNLLLAVVIAFFTLLLPRHIIILYFEYMGWQDYVPGSTMSVQTYFYLMYFAFLPYPLHVAINPLIYTFATIKWRKKIREFSKQVFDISEWSVKI